MVTSSDPLPELLELCTDVEVDVVVAVEAEVNADVEVGVDVVSVTVVVDVLWIVVCDTLPTLELLPLSPVDAPKGDIRTGAPPIVEGAPPLNAWVATTSEPAPARTTRVSTDMTDSF